MKQTVLFLSAVLASIVAHAQLPPGHPPPPDLRLVLAQKPVTGQSAVRQLSPQERAELRRQVLQFSKPPAKGS